MGDSPTREGPGYATVSDYRNFWNNEKWKLYAKYSEHHYLSCLFHMQNLFQNDAYAISEMVNIYRFFVKKIQILCSSNHTILFKFCQFGVKIVNKELQIVF